MLVADREAPYTGVRRVVPREYGSRPFKGREFFILECLTRTEPEPKVNHGLH